MSLPRYPEYKNSGFDWATELPAHWGTASLKWLCQRYSGGTPDKNKLEFWEEGTIPWLNSGAVNDGRIYDASAYITQEAFENSSAKWIPPGALVMALAGQGKTKGMVAQLMFRSTCNQSMAALVPTDRINARCLYWWLTCNYQNIRNMAGGDLRDGLNLELLGAIPCPLPPIEEQAAIATFLDRETGKIDALIAEQEKLLALLAEKRQATISHAVTKGLNPDAPMKDSSVAWLGEVPEHWGHSKKLLDLVTSHRHAFVNGPFGSDLLTSELVSEGVPVVYIRDIKESGYIRVSEWCVTKEKATQLEFCNAIPGDLVVAKVGDPPGLTAIYPEGEPEGIVTQDVIRLRLDSAKSHSGYIRWLLNSKYGQTAIDQISVESTRTRVGLGEYKQLRFFIPPLEEQRAISDFLDNEMGRLDALAAEASRAVDLLKERRSALIAAAVTGQIDVRGLVTEPEAA